MNLISQLIHPSIPVDKRTGITLCHPNTPSAPYAPCLSSLEQVVLNKCLVRIGGFIAVCFGQENLDEHWSHMTSNALGVNNGFALNWMELTDWREMVKWMWPFRMQNSDPHLLFIGCFSSSKENHPPHTLLPWKVLQRILRWKPATILVSYFSPLPP